MHCRSLLVTLLFSVGTVAAAYGQESATKHWWDRDVQTALEQARDNRSELEKALHAVPKEQRPGLAFLIANMPGKDLVSLKADFLLKNVDLAYQARAQMPWGHAVPEELFLNDVLPYASTTETREPWRQDMMALCLPIVREAKAKTITEAAQALNAVLSAKAKVRYSTQRKRPDQSPSESMKTGLASCTGLSILLIDACRSVGIPARLVAIKKWANKPGNHTWVEIWDGSWHFTGACEPNPMGLDRAWFISDAALAQKDSIDSAIFASSFKRTKTQFPQAWAPAAKDVFAENVTQRYTQAKEPALPEVKVETFTPLADEQHQRIFDAAKDFFDSGKKLDPALDDILKANEEGVRQSAWKAYAASKLHTELRADFDKKQVRNDKYLSPYSFKHVGKKPKTGWPVFIAMHGGGGVPKEINDKLWRIMHEYYRDQDPVEGYTYIALRAPNDLWNGFYDDYVCPLIINLIRQFVLFDEADIDKAFIMGYSHGGYGAFFIGPKIPDRFAAVHVSAAAPSDGQLSGTSLRNTRFTFMIGEFDRAYGRIEGCKNFYARIEKLRKENPGEFPVEMDLKKGMAHGGLPDRDKIKEMYPYRRNAVPKRLTWEPTDPFVKDFFWASIDKPGRGQAIDVKVAGNTVTVRSDKVDRLTLWLDGRLVNARQPIELIVNGKASQVNMTPSLATLCESILRRGDPSLAASGRIDIDTAGNK